MIKTVFIILNDYNNFNRLRLNLIKKLSINTKVIVFLNFNNNLKSINQHSSDNLKFVDLKFDNGINIFKFFLILFKIFKFSLRLKPFIVYSFTIKPNIISIILSYFYNTKYVITFTGLGNFYINNPKIYLSIFKLLFFNSSKNLNTVFHNKTDKKLFEEKFNIKKAFLVNGSGIDMLKKIPLNKKIDFNLRIISISRAIKEKGIIEFLNIVNKYSDINNIHFTLITDLNKAEIYKRFKIKLQKHNKNFKIINKNYDYLDYLKKNDLFILLSKREGLSHAMINALNLGLPCITLNVPGNNDLIVNNYNGFLIKNDNHIEENVYSNINKLLKNSKFYSSLSNNASKSINDTFSKKSVLNFYQNFLSIK